MTVGKIVKIYGNKVVSVVLIASLYVTVISAGWFLAYTGVHAATLTSVSDTLSVSTPSSASDHLIKFTATSAIPAGGSISIDFQGTSVVFATGSVDFTDIDVSDSVSGERTLAAVTSGDSWGAAINGSKIDLVVGDTTAVTAGAVITIEVGLNATAGVSGDAQLTNPIATAGTKISISTFNASNVAIDTGFTYVAIVSQVTLQATIDETFLFSISGVSSGKSLDDGGDTVDVTSTSTLVPFGTLTANTPIMGASSLSVTSNAINGFTVTVEQNFNMTASNGADIDCFANGSTCGDGGEASWSSPTAVSGNENTYGHLGLYTEDGSGLAAIIVAASISSGTTGTFFGLNGTTPIQIWNHSGVGDGETQDTGSINVIYRIEVSGLQESGTYTNKLMYIATPTF